MLVIDGLDLASQQLHHLADGSAADDAAAWGQVQNLLAGLEWKVEVRVATTANVSITSAPSSIDSVALASGDRVWVKNQTTASENGIRVFTSAGAAMNRATDMDASTEFNNATAFVVEGTTNANTAWTCQTKNPTVDTTAIVIAQFGGGATYTAATSGGLSLTGNAFAIKLPGSGVVGLVVDSTGIYIDTSVVVTKFAQLVGDGSSTSIAVPHNLGSRDVSVSLQDASTHQIVYLTPVATDVNTVTLNFPVAPTLNKYRVTIHA